MLCYKIFAVDSRKIIWEGKSLDINYTINLDIEHITTPIKLDEYSALLNQSRYPEEEKNFLIQGFTNGFDIGYNGPRERVSKSDNLPFRIGNPVELWNKVMKEVQLGRYAGPFEEVPYEFFIQSPIGLVPKDGGRKSRLISPFVRF